MSKKSLRLTDILVFIIFSAMVPCHVGAISLGGFEIDGFIRNNTGVWTENWDYAANNDPLATCRNWFRLNLKGDISSSLSLRAEVLAVYEPEYSRERGSGVKANDYNYFDFRELRLDWSPSPGHSIMIGRQIVNWGEALSARVGDVINPQDLRFELGFTNLEDTRMPIWMARGLHQLNLFSSTVDWVFSPYMEPDRYRVNRIPSAALTVNSDGSFKAAPRFAGYPETRIEEQFGTHNAMIAIPGAGLGGTTLVMAGPVSGPPFSHMYQGLDLIGGPVAPMDAATATAVFGPAFAGTPYPAQGVYFTRPPSVTIDYPDSSLTDSRFGFKTSTPISGWQTGVYFWRSNELSPIMRIKGGLASGLNIVVEYPQQNVYGFYANKGFDFGLLRFDAAYRPNRDYSTTDLAEYSEGVAEKDNLLFQIGFNKDVMWQNINPSSAFSFIVEYVGNFILESDLDNIHVPTYFIPYHKDQHTFMASVGTTYSWGMYGYNLTLIYDVRGSGLLQPKITYTPEWDEKKSWKFSLMYANVFGDNDYDYPYGLLRDSDMVVLTTQFDF